MQSYEQQLETCLKNHGIDASITYNDYFNRYDITYSAWSDECDAPAEIHAVFVFYKNERTINATDDLVKTMTEMIQEILDVAEQDN